MTKRSAREVERTERKGLERLARRIKKSSDWSKVLAKIETDNAHLEGNDE